jgi:hypothetical protein
VDTTAILRILFDVIDGDLLIGPEKIKNSQMHIMKYFPKNKRLAAKKLFFKNRKRN